MAKADSNGIQIEYETFGDQNSRPLLLIMGLAGQLIYWDEKLCEQLAQQGHYVIRFDNRDVGLSTKIEEAGVPDVMKAIEAKMGNRINRQNPAKLGNKNRKTSRKLSCRSDTRRIIFRPHTT